MGIYSNETQNKLKKNLRSVNKNTIFVLYKNKEVMEKQQYAKIIFNGSTTYMVVDSANQCRFASSSERKAKNFLAKLLKSAGF